METLNNTINPDGTWFSEDGTLLQECGCCGAGVVVADCVETTLCDACYSANCEENPETDCNVDWYEIALCSCGHTPHTVRCTLGPSNPSFPN